MTLKEFVDILKEAITGKDDAEMSAAQDKEYVTCHLCMTDDGNISHEKTAIQVELLLKK